MYHLLIESHPEFPYLLNVDMGSGPMRLNKGFVVNVLSSCLMGRFVKKLEADGCLDVELAQSEFDCFRRGVERR